MAADVFADLSRHVDRAFYRHRYPDIARAGLDPVAHWHTHGWAERRRPNIWFDTAHYLDTYPDIAAARIDPLLHYLRHGHAEGREPRPRNAERLAALAAARPAAQRPVGYDAPPHAPILDAQQFAASLLPAMAARAGRIGLVVAASHDRYIDVTGGIQLVLADEQAACAAAGTTHLHLAPAIARLRLADDIAPAGLLQVTLDGRFHGLIPGNAAVAAIAEVALALPDRPRRMVIHSLLGHRTDTLRALAAACAGEAVFWLHDHTSLCEGFTLLRNDLDACGAPGEDSMACRICVHGESRVPHRARIRALFDAVPMHILAPSRPTLDLWLARARLPFASAHVSEPARLLPRDPQPRHDHETNRAAPLRTAFLGYPLAHKGWPLFLELAATLELANPPLANSSLAESAPTTPACALYHFATEPALLPMDRVTSIPLRVDPGARDAAVTALAEHRIEAVLIPSPWPETFSFVAHEAVAAGAHVLTLAAAGNIPAMLRRHANGHVFATGEELIAYLASGRAREAIRAAPPPPRFTLQPAKGSLTLLEALLDNQLEAQLEAHIAAGAP